MFVIDRNLSEHSICAQSNRSGSDVDAFPGSYFGARPGYALNSDFDGKDWNHWYESSVAGKQPDPDVCKDGSRQGMVCTTDDTDMTTGCPGASPAPGNTPPFYCFPYCNKTPLPPLNRPLPADFCSNPYPYYADKREDWAMTIYQANSGAWLFNAATNDWAWGLDDYFTDLRPLLRISMTITTMMA